MFINAIFNIQITILIHRYVTQGSFVAMIFCFFNGEVISLVKRTIKQRKLMSGTRSGSNHPSMGSHPARTFYTQSMSLIDTHDAGTNNGEGTISILVYIFLIYIYIYILLGMFTGHNCDVSK